MAIVGNKIDLEQNRVITSEQTAEFATQVGAIHFETSAKDNVGVDDLFKKLGEKVGVKLAMFSDVLN